MFLPALSWTGELSLISLDYIAEAKHFLIFVSEFLLRMSHIKESLLQVCGMDRTQALHCVLLILTLKVCVCMCACVLCCSVHVNVLTEALFALHILFCR